MDDTIRGPDTYWQDERQSSAEYSQDAEFKLAMEFEIQSINHMRHVKGIVDRRGLVVEAEES